MQKEDQIIIYLKQLTDTAGIINQKVDALDQKIDSVEENLNRRIDKLESRIDEIELRLEEVKSYLDDKIDLIEKALDTEIDKVYQIAHKNEYNIEMLLIPYNERNLHVNDELAKMARYGERMDEVEAVLESHSEAIQRLQNNMQCPAIAPGM